MHELRKYIRLLIQEYNIPKGEPYEVGYEDPDRFEFAEDIVDLMYNAYKKMGGHVKISDSASLEKNYGITKRGQWIVADLDDDDDIDVAMIGKEDPRRGGIKLGAAAAKPTDPVAKAWLKNYMADKFKSGDWWGEASGLAAISMIKRGAPIIDSEELAREINPKAGDWHGAYPLPVDAEDEGGMVITADHPFRQVNGWYSRTWQGVEHFKLMFVKT